MRLIENLEPRTYFGGGTPDPTFGENGVATGDISTTLPAGEWAIHERLFTQDSGGRVYVLAVAPNDAFDADGPYKLVVTRFTRDGQLDTRFNDTGYKLLDGYFPPGTTYPQFHIFVDPNNRVHVMDGPVVWRLTPGGRADQTFGRKGKIIPRSSLMSKIIASPRRWRLIPPAGLTSAAARSERKARAWPFSV